MPESWKRPVVNSMLLPVHAETSGSCSAGSLTIDTDDGDEFGINDSIALIFDGNTCSLEQIPSDTCNGCDPDTMIVIDNDINDPSGFSMNAPHGSNWASGPNEQNLSADSYTRSSQRVAGVNSGNNYNVSFTVSFSDPSEMTVSNVSFSLVL